MNYSIEKLLESRKISSEKIGFDQIEKQYKRSFKDLETTMILLDHDRDTAYTVCYNSLLHMGRTLMFCMGYRPIGESKHRIVVEFCLAVLGNEYKSVIDRYDKARQKRNKLIYETPELETPEKEILVLIEFAKKFREIVQNKIKEINPQLELFN